MKKKSIIDLSDIFLVPLFNNLIGSFIKVVGSGTGLGKTYSCILALVIYLRALSKSSDEQDKKIMAIFTAPQHNQISFPEKLTKELEKLDCKVVRIKPISPFALSNINNDTNAYDVCKFLFFSELGKTNTLFRRLVDAAVKTDKASNQSGNRTSLTQTMNGINHTKINIDGILGKISASENSSTSIQIDFNDYNMSEQERMEELEYYSNQIQVRTKMLAADLQKILLNSYKNDTFRRSIEQSLSPKLFRQFRDVTATFYPFLEYQTNPEHHALMGMTIAKLLTRHHVFAPSYHQSKHILVWRVKSVSLEEIINDTLDFNTISRQEIDTFDNCPEETKYDTMPTARKLFDAEIHLYIDESDDSKKAIANMLNTDLNDVGVIQASGSLAKEAGDVLYSHEHTPLVQQLPKNNHEAYRFLTSGLHDDGIERRICKDLLRRIQDVILKFVSQTQWAKGKTELETRHELFNDISILARTLLTAPFCTVEFEVEKEVFEATSVFGGEMFGFVGSRQVDRYVVVTTRSSMRITEPRFLHGNESYISLRSLFILITINWFIFRSIAKHGGGKAADESMRASIVNHLSAMIQASDAITANDKVDEFIKFVNKIPNQPTGALTGISGPFRPETRRISSSVKHHDYHTITTLAPQIASNLLAEKFSGAFSPVGSDLDTLLGDNTQHFNTILEHSVDIEFGYRRANTIFGMVQVNNSDYLIDQTKTHVAFPVKFRRESAESYLQRLVSTENRRVCCFLMSATGAFENSHISAWSMLAMEQLSENANVEFLRMNLEDYAITAAKQQERGVLKDIYFSSIESMPEGEFIAPAEIIYRTYLARAKELDADYEGYSSTITNQLIGLSNRYKRIELNNILKCLDFIHNTEDGLDRSDRPHFGLVLTQTHQKASAVFTLFSRQEIFKTKHRRYSLERLLSSGIGTSNGDGVGYSIFRLKTLGKNSRFEKATRDTIIICYAAALDKALAKIYKESFSNPHSREYKLKKLLGMQPQKGLPDAFNSDFNAMNYFLNENHGCNVLIISAYQSAARGINLIVNKQTPASRSSKSSSARISDTQLGLLDENAAPDQTSIPTERDLDYLFIASPPFYSEIQQDISMGMDYDSAQRRFFHKCDRYFHYIEWSARSNQNQPRNQLKNTQVDLTSPDEDPEVDLYFEQQHAISVFSALQQGLGRMERTNSQQSQKVFLCDGATDVILEGIRAITRGHSDHAIDQLLGAMSVVNAQLARMVLNGDIQSSCQRLNNKSFSIESKRARFELLKRESFLKAIERYRMSTSLENLDANTLIEIEFYEAFRSVSLWTEGYSAYINGMQRILDRMPRHLKLGYKRLVKMLFEEYDTFLDEYISLSGFPVDVENMISNKYYAKVNPYHTIIEGRHIYPAPWFLPDLDGNYGELVIQLAINELCHLSSGVSQLNRHTSEIARRAYEYADFFILRGNVLVAVDAKHYMANRSRYIGRYADTKWTNRFKAKLQRNQERIQTFAGSIKVHLVAINIYLADDSDGIDSEPPKSVGASCYLLNSNSKLSSIIYNLNKLLTKEA